MPIVLRRRKRRINAAWKTWKKYFVYFRLWLWTKRRINSNIIIKKFLKDTLSAGLVCTRIHSYRAHVLKCQRIIRYHLAHRRRQYLLLSLMYTRIEGKVLRGQPVVGEVADMNLPFGIICSEYLPQEKPVFIRASLLVFFFL